MKSDGVKLGVINRHREKDDASGVSITGGIDLGGQYRGIKSGCGGDRSGGDFVLSLADCRAGTDAILRALTLAATRSDTAIFNRHRTAIDGIAGAVADACIFDKNIDRHGNLDLGVES